MFERVLIAASKLQGKIQRRLDRAASRALARRFAECGAGVQLKGRIAITAPERVRCGSNVHIGDNAYVRAEGGLTIGDNTHISRNLALYTCNHQYQGKRLPYDETTVGKPVEIGRNVWIGMNVCVAPGAKIGDGAIIGMGAVVSGEVEPLAIVGSQPLRVLGQRDEDHYRDLESRGAFGGASGRAL